MIAYLVGGGICVYIKDDVPCKRRVDLENPDFECLWFSLRPECLPRPLSGIVICVVYHPPGRTVQDHKDLDEYLINTTDQLRNKDPDHGLVFLGDFNDFDIRNITSNHSLKQIVNQPTRGNAILDLIITNLHNLYSCPSILAPLGSSDHNVVQWLPSSENSKPLSPVRSVKRKVRRYPRSGIDAFGRWITTHNWFEELGPNPSVDDLTTRFTTQLTKAMDQFFPAKTLRFHMHIGQAMDNPRNQVDD